MPFVLNKQLLNGVIFDMDGVLVDTSPCHALAFEKLWASLGLEGPEYIEISGRATKEVIAQYAQHLDESQHAAAIEFKQKVALEIIASMDISFSDTENSLSKLFNLNIPMVVATSASKASATLALNNAKISQFFNQVITSADVQNAKPAPDIFLTAIKALNFSSDECLVVEDSVSGISAGLASGAKVVSIRTTEILPIHLTSHDNYLGHFSGLSELSDCFDETIKR